MATNGGDDGINGNGKRSRGAPKHNTNHESHGIVTWMNQRWRRKRRGRSLIDMRTEAGMNATAVRDEMLSDLGGAENLSAAKLVLIEMVARDTYFLDEIDRRIFKAIAKMRAWEKSVEPLGKAKNPANIAKLYVYRQSAANNLARNLLALGLEKAPPKQKTLEEILAEDEEKGESR